MDTGDEVGSNLTRTDRPLCGVLIPEDRLELWRDESTNLDEAEPFAGNPVESRSTGMVLSSSGTPENLDTLEIQSQFAGFPGFNGASFLYRQDTTPAQDWRGWDSPSAVTYTEIPTWSTSTSQGRRHPSVTALKDGSVLVVADYPNTTSGVRRVSRKIRSTFGIWGNWSAVHTENTTPGISFGMLFPKTIQREDGVVELFFLHQDRDHRLGNLSKMVSTDSGVNFELAQDKCLAVSISLGTAVAQTFEPEQMQIAYANGQHLMILELREGGTAARSLVQYASRDGGATFELIGASIDDARSSGIATAGGFFIVSYRSGPDEVETRRLGSAYSALSEAALEFVTLGHQTALASSDNDEVYLFTYYENPVQKGTIYRSINYGETWDGSDAKQVFKFETFGINYPSMDWWRGTLVLVSNNGTFLGRHSLQVFHLGGFSTLTLPNSAFNQIGIEQMSWSETYIPYGTVDVVTNMVATLGAGTVVTVSGGLQNMTAGSSIISRYTETALAVVRETLIRAAISTTRGRTNLYARSGTAAIGHEVRVQLDETTLEMFDVSGAQIGATVVTSPGSLYDILIAVRSDVTAGSAWYRLRGPGTEERTWTLLATSTGLNDDGGTGAFGTTTSAVHYQVGRLGAPLDVDLAEMMWDEVAYSYLSEGQTSPDELYARNYTLKSTYVHDGVGIAATGITRRGDIFTVSPQHTYQADNAIAVNSPRVGWRSLTTLADMTLAFRFPTTVTRWPNDLIAVYMDKINFKDFDIEIRQGGVWVALSSFNVSYNVSYDTIGDSIIPRTTGVNQGDRRSFYQNELVGGTFEYPGAIVRPIIRNLPGIDDRGSPVSKRVVYYLDPASITGAEPAGPAGGASTWYPRCLALIRLKGNRSVEGIRINVRPSGTAPAPHAGYYEIGQLCIGAVAVLGWAPNNTRSTGLELADEIIQEVDGTRSITKMGSVDRRRVEIAWARNSRQTEIQVDGSPNYVKACTDTAGEPVATRFGTPIEFTGLLAQHGKKPLVYIPNFLYQEDTDTFLASHYCKGSIYGRVVVDSYRVETAAGIPEETETVRTSVVTIEEEI